MSSAAEESLTKNRSIIGAVVRVPARFFRTKFAKPNLGKDGEEVEHTYKIAIFWEGSKKLTA